MEEAFRLCAIVTVPTPAFGLLHWVVASPAQSSLLEAVMGAAVKSTISVRELATDTVKFLREV